MASFLTAPRTGNGVVDPNDLKRVENTGQDRSGPGNVSLKTQAFASLLPPHQLAHEQFLPAFQQSILPAVAGAQGLAGQAEYMAAQSAPRRDVTTLFHALAPTAQQFPRALDSENAMAAPGRVRMPQLFKIFSKPRAGRPGANPFGFNNTPTS